MKYNGLISHLKKLVWYNWIALGYFLCFQNNSNFPEEQKAQKAPFLRWWSASRHPASLAHRWRFWHPGKLVQSCAPTWTTLFTSLCSSLLQKRRSGRHVKRKKYLDDLDLDLSEEEDEPSKRAKKAGEVTFDASAENSLMTIDSQDSMVAKPVAFFVVSMLFMVEAAASPQVQSLRPSSYWVLCPSRVPPPLFNVWYDGEAG